MHVKGEKKSKVQSPSNLGVCPPRLNRAFFHLKLEVTEGRFGHQPQAALLPPPDPHRVRLKAEGYS